MNAKLIFKQEFTVNGAIISMVIWRLPSASEERPHALKYRLHCGRGDECIVRYDNETGKGDHIHYGMVEKSYHFTTMDSLILDFHNDVQRLTR
jgi:hypothetical protein